MFYALHSTLFCAEWLILLMIGQYPQEMRRFVKLNVTETFLFCDKWRVTAHERKKTEIGKKLG